MCALAFSSGASERCRDGKLYTCQTCVRNISEERLLLLPIPRCPVLLPTRPQTAVSHTRVLAVGNDILKPDCQCSVPAPPQTPCESTGWWWRLCWDWAGGPGRRALHLLSSRQGWGGGTRLPSALLSLVSSPRARAAAHCRAPGFCGAVGLGAAWVQAQTGNLLCWAGLTDSLVSLVQRYVSAYAYATNRRCFSLCHIGD